MERVTIVVWDNIGNTLVGGAAVALVIPGHPEPAARRRPRGRGPRPPLGRLLAGTKVDVRWFLKRLPGLGIFGTLTEDFAPAPRRWTSNDDLADAVTAAANLVLH